LPPTIALTVPSRGSRDTSPGIRVIGAVQEPEDRLLGVALKLQVDGGVDLQAALEDERGAVLLLEDLLDVRDEIRGMEDAVFGVGERV
jgi:hypothetical protein